MAIEIPDTPGPSQRSANMRAIRRRDSAAELALRSELHRRGRRYRVDFPVAVVGRPPRPDIAFTRQKLAVFVDGCFWHGCPQHGRRPKQNSHYWGPKIARNVERDKEQEVRLTSAGWAVVRVWEHEDPEDAADRIEQLLSSRASSQ
jgi:DNA mismatch endonuclease, patch repair protein